MIHYQLPTSWIKYDKVGIVGALTEAKAAVLSLQTVPYQRRWVEALQRIELKREVAGTSRIEGAEFTETELERVMKEETPDELFTRSQRQAAAALKAYEWIKTVEKDRPIDADLIRRIHRLMVTEADDDHCVPGELRTAGQNVTFGTPKHRGCEGGEECAAALDGLVGAIQNEFAAHDKLVQALAAHFHIAAMHPFLDGNGRTARALEALMLRRADMRDTTFIAMSNYYYDEKASYLASLAAVRQRDGDLTPFLLFGLRGVELQAKRLLAELQREIKRELFRTLMHDLFGRRMSPRKRVLAERQLALLGILLDHRDGMHVNDFIDAALKHYRELSSDFKGLGRDVGALSTLKAITYDLKTETIRVNLDWPTIMTETEFFNEIRKMPIVSVPWLTR